MPRLGRVSAGQRLSIDHNAYNAFVEAARARESVGPVDRGEASQRSANLVTVRNSSGGPVPRFGVLGMRGPIFDITDNAREFARCVTADGDAPEAGTDEGKFVILLQPLDDGRIGRAVVDGVVQALVRLTAGAEEWAEIADGSNVYLDASADGSAQILWQDDASSATAQAPSATDTGAETVTIAGHGLATGAMVTPSATGGGLLSGTVYFVKAVDANTLAFFMTAANAAADTSRIDLASAITATLYPVRWAIVRLTSTPAAPASGDTLFQNYFLS